MYINMVLQDQHYTLHNLLCTRQPISVMLSSNKSSQHNSHSNIPTDPALLMHSTASTYKMDRICHSQYHLSYSHPQHNSLSKHFRVFSVANVHVIKHMLWEDTPLIATVAVSWLSCKHVQAEPRVSWTSDAVECYLPCLSIQLGCTLSIHKLRQLIGTQTSANRWSGSLSR